MSSSSAIASNMLLGVPSTKDGASTTLASLSFANTSSSILVAKVQGSIIDVLMPPLSAGELVVAFVAGALTRAWLARVAARPCILAALAMANTPEPLKTWAPGPEINRWG